LNDAIIMLPMQKQMRCPGEGRPLFFSGETIMEAADAAYTQNVIPLADHRQNRDSYVLCLLDGAMLKLEQSN